MKSTLRPLIFACLLLPSLAFAGTGTRVVKKANETISAKLKIKAAAGSAKEAKLAKEVTSSVRGFLDVDELGRRALKNHWAKITPAQQKEYLDLLRSLVEANYVKGLRANLKYKVHYLGEEAKKDGQILVKTEVKTKRRGRPYTVSVDYLLRKDGGKHRAFDVFTDGVGLVENYRAQFGKLISKYGMDGLLKRMRKKLAKS